MSFKYILVLTLASLFTFENNAQVNPKANKETKNLYRNLSTLPNGNFLFGHQDDLAYGIGCLLYTSSACTFLDI